MWHCTIKATARGFRLLARLFGDVAAPLRRGGSTRGMMHRRPLQTPAPTIQRSPIQCAEQSNDCRLIGYSCDCARWPAECRVMLLIFLGSVMAQAPGSKPPEKEPDNTAESGTEDTGYRRVWRYSSLGHGGCHKSAEALILGPSARSSGSDFFRHFSGHMPAAWGVWWPSRPGPEKLTAWPASRLTRRRNIPNESPLRIWSVGATPRGRAPRPEGKPVPVAHLSSRQGSPGILFGRQQGHWRQQWAPRNPSRSAARSASRSSRDKARRVPQWIFQAMSRL